MSKVKVPLRRSAARTHCGVSENVGLPMKLLIHWPLALTILLCKSVTHQYFYQKAQDLYSSYFVLNPICTPNYQQRCHALHFVNSPLRIFFRCFLSKSCLALNRFCFRRDLRSSANVQILIHMKLVHHKY